MLRCAVILLSVAVGLPGAALCANDPTIPPDQLVFFESKIRPVLAEHCFDCHSEDVRESDLDLSSRQGLLRGGSLGPALNPQNPRSSLLLSVVRHDEFIRMPPKEKLSIRQIADLTRWVEMGAPWPDSGSVPLVSEADDGAAASPFTEEQRTHWAFQPVADPVPPDVPSGWITSPIDRFVLGRLQEAGLQPAPRTDRRTLIRRVTYDLTGLPPTPQEVAAFLRDESPQAFARLVDRLLDSPRYGEHWGRHWLDVARYADSNGLDENLSYANAWHYRDYVISAFNSDKPWPRFVQEQIAGDLLPEVEDEQENLHRYIATGFLALGPKMLAEDDPVKMQMDIVDEQLSTLGQTFMGLTLGCARCHDHKFDPLPTEDYYSLAGIFTSSRTMENHKVVAVWYERPLASQTVLDEIAETERQLKATQSQIDGLLAEQRKVVADHMQLQLADYLLAAAELQRACDRPLPRRHAQQKQEAPFRVTEGVAVIEAEAFHRGDIEFQSTGYGNGIGVVLSRGAGFVEYDLEAEQGGAYQLELRLAANDSRPVQLYINGRLMDEAVAGQVTGSWYPNGQRWFVGGLFELTAGKNTIRLQRDDVFPHLDRLVVVAHGNDDRPTDPQAAFLSEIATRHDVNLPLAEVWRGFLERLESGAVDGFPSFAFWATLSQSDQTSFEQSLNRALDERDGQLPVVMKTALRDAQPASLQAVAAVFQTLLQTSRDALPAAWFSESSPLSGPARLTASHLRPQQRQQLRELRQQQAGYEREIPVLPVAMGVTEGTPEDLQVHLRGSHIALGKTVPRQFPRIIGNLNAAGVDPQQSGRLQLAQWLTQPDHPLLNRVLVNRVWHWHFGRGLTPSVDNFGLLGQPPSHPQLLDWLTSRFVESGGSVKQLHRLILLSSTYQMSSQFNAEANEVDPDIALLWRFRRRRQTGEQLRDSLIAVGSGLDLTMGGSLLKVANRKYVTVSGTSITTEFTNHRRSVYLPVVRSSVYDVLQAFDFPDPAVATGQRQTSTVAPQALMMMNSELVEEQTRAMAESLQPEESDVERVRSLYLRLFSREPSTEETAAALALTEQLVESLGNSEDGRLQSWQSLCRVLVSSNEFVYVE